MSIKKLHLIVVGIALAACLLAAVRNYLPLLLFAGAAALVVLVPIGLLIWSALTVLRATTASNSTASQASPSSVSVTSAAPSGAAATALSQRLEAAFRRNQANQLDQVLSHLPPWPLSEQVRTTAQTLLALKRSVYRAQAEGVPASMVQRYLTNTTQAANSLWQMASKLDALGQQNVAYTLLAPRLVQEEQRVAQLQRAAHTAQEAIALLIVSGIQSNALEQADDDLSALTHAIKQVTR